jgi:AcrR family transcriptional regulator
MNQYSGSLQRRTTPPSRSRGRAAPASKPPTARGKRSREKILRAAEHVFGRKSYTHAGIADIARKAGVALGSFYVYFPDKRAVFIELIDELGMRLRSHLAAAVGHIDNRIDTEIEGLRAFFAFADEHRLLYRIVREAEFVDEPTFRRYYARMAEGYVRGLRAAADAHQIHAPDPEALAYALMGMADFLGMRFVLWGRAKNREHVIRAAAEFLRRGLTPLPRNRGPAKLTVLRTKNA